MKLDDRPVIDQLLSPTPLNILDEVQADEDSLIDSGQHVTAKSVLDVLRRELEFLDLDLSEGTMTKMDEALSCAADEVADLVAGASYRAVEAFAGRLYERFDS